MQYKKLYVQLLFSFSMACSFSTAQETFLPLNRDFSNKYDANLNTLSCDFHTDIKPYRIGDLKNHINSDSVDNSYFFDAGKKRSWLERKIRKENFLLVNTEDFSLTADPLVNFEMNNDISNNKHALLNTRGVQVFGSIGKEVSFYTSFFENQATFVNYIDTFIQKNSVIPGQGVPKAFKGKAGKYDFAYATGYVSFTPSKHFNFQFGNDKNFIGDGYRSLILSDNSFSYPFLKITTSVWKIKYMNLYTTMLDIHDPPLAFNNDDFHRKYVSMHYLSYNVYKRLTVGFFEGIVLRGRDSTSFRGYDWNYLNPVIFLRPVEFSLGSSDNALMGINSKFKVCNTFLLYMQVVLDEFKLSEVKAGNGWHGNKQAVQFGWKYHDVFTVKNLNWQTELNYVRPFMYSHYKLATSNIIQNYTHYGQALAHPLGANFMEVLSFLNYRYKCFFVEGKLSFAYYGEDIYDSISGNYRSFGKDIFRSYYDRGNGDYGYRVGSGDKTVLAYQDFRVACILNPKTNLCLEAGVTLRTLANSASNISHNNMIHVSLRSSLNNFYYDF